MIFPPINIPKWLEENEHLLQPPVNNYCLHDSHGLVTMIIGGPNARTDYHVNQTPELFYQYRGPMSLKIVEGNQSKIVEIAEGSVFLLPPNVPHSPVRYANTVGIVIEQQRPPEMQDEMRWYCAECGNLVHRASFHMSDLGTQVKKTIEELHNNKKERTCSCGNIIEVRPQHLPSAPTENLDTIHDQDV